MAFADASIVSTVGVPPLAEKLRHNAAWQLSKPLLTGALSGMIATSCVQPLDMVKVRLQLATGQGQSTSPFTIAMHMLRREGFLSFYKGLSAAVTRQVVYTGGRFGLFDILMDRSQDRVFDSVPGFVKKAACSIVAGGLAAAVANPTDIVLVRMQADTTLPLALRRNYQGFGHALLTIARTEGVRGLFKGVSLTATRAMGSTFGTLAFNAQAKEVLQRAGAPAQVAVIGGSLAGGFAASFLGLPFDFVKTQVQQMKPDPVTGVMPYSGPLDCACKQFQHGGILRFWSAFPTYYARVAPQVGIALLVQHQIKSIWISLGV